MFEIEVDGETWRYAFVEPDAILSFEDREHLVAETARLYHSGRRHKMIKGKGFEGRIAKGKYFCLAGFGGGLYDAELETEKGKRNAGLLVAEVVNAEMN